MKQCVCHHHNQLQCEKSTPGEILVTFAHWVCVCVCVYVVKTIFFLEECGVGQINAQICLAW